MTSFSNESQMSFCCILLLWMETTLCILYHFVLCKKLAQIAKFMGPTWGPPGSCQIFKRNSLNLIHNYTLRVQDIWNQLNHYKLVIDVCIFVQSQIGIVYIHVLTDQLNHYKLVIDVCIFVQSQIGICSIKRNIDLFGCLRSHKS